MEKNYLKNTSPFIAIRNGTIFKEPRFDHIRFVLNGNGKIGWFKWTSV